MKRTFQPSIIHKKRIHGFLKKMKNKNGRSVIKARRSKKRKKL